ncbi:MAG: hypothetical protein PHQ67_05725 [Fermentimonas sp.]|jgi:hypothetical protein|nr:hypothetical protein [Fermentimonas sp.]MDD4009295.1 hypothetical protein [Fermentimonas sp.]MDD4698145.1 hypothetical protein [Fermentimonas sp.]
MKTKLFLLILFSIGCFSVTKAQYVNETLISEIEADYIRVWSDSGPLLSSRITVRMDWGQGGRTPQIADERRRPISFNGMIDALNLLSKEGFELVEIVRDSKDENEIFYLKRKNNTYSENDYR